MSVMASQITSLTIVYSTVFFKAQIKENIKAPRHWPLWGEFTSNAENVSIWWCHHVTIEKIIWNIDMLLYLLK